MESKVQKIENFNILKDLKPNLHTLTVSYKNGYCHYLRLTQDTCLSYTGISF